jgi:integrase
LGAWLQRFIEHKRSLGYKYQTEAAILSRFDRFLWRNHPDEDTLSRPLVEAWCARLPHERARSHQTRISVTSLFIRFLVRNGVEACLPSITQRPIDLKAFTPHIFTRAEMGRILAASERLGADGRSPKRHASIPAIFHLLYGCGLRVSEALALKVADVDLESGVLVIRQTKFGKDRLAPMSPSLVDRLRALSAQQDSRREGDEYFFASPTGKHYHNTTIYNYFRRFLRAAGIPHGGRGQGPRLHDLRHTFAVHRLELWYRQGEDLGAKLPVLATYMGHQCLTGTQRYLRLTPEIFPDIQRRLDQRFGQIIPPGGQL